MVRISVILRTRRLPNKTCDIRNSISRFKIWKEHPELLDNSLINNEFNKLYYSCLEPSNDLFEMTMKSFEKQTYKNFEFILVHPDADKLDVNKYSKYKDAINLKIVKNKYSPYLEVDNNHFVFCGTTNTGIIWSDGDIIHVINDNTLYPKNYLKEVEFLYNRNMLAVPPRIEYSYSVKNKYDKLKREFGIKEEFETPILRTTNYPAGKPKASYKDWSAWWGYGFTFDREELLDINGYNEELDGAVGDDDYDYWSRMRQITKYKPTQMRNVLYSIRSRRNEAFINQPKPKFETKSNRQYLKMIEQYPVANEIVANVKRPSKDLMNKYKDWHYKHKSKNLDKYYYLCSEIPTFDLRKLITERNTNKIDCGELIL